MLWITFLSVREKYSFCCSVVNSSKTLHLLVSIVMDNSLTPKMSSMVYLTTKYFCQISFRYGRKREYMSIMLGTYYRTVPQGKKSFFFPLDESRKGNEKERYSFFQSACADLKKRENALLFKWKNKIYNNNNKILYRSFLGIKSSFFILSIFS